MATMATMTAAPCQVCGHARFTVLYPVTDKNQGVPGTWSIAACTACGLGRLDPMPDAPTVATFYRDVFYAEDGKRFRPWVENLRRGITGLRGLRLRRMLPAGSRLLDFGAGSGHFADSMRMHGWDAVAHDPFNNTADAATNAAADRPVDRTTLDYPDRHFDAVTLWYVIEHLLDPRDAIREFHRVLRPGGILVLSQQDFSSVQARLFKARWLFLDPPRHLFQFSPATLGRMAEQEGFRVRHVSSASLECGPFTILQSLLNSLVGNENYLFRFLKSRQLGGQSGPAGAPHAVLGLAASALLLPALLPLSVILYFVLLGARSGDVFTMYLERTGESGR
jgi:SAM-dependent methyltransferase